MSVRAEIEDERLTLQTGGTELGSWPISSLEPQARGAGVGLNLDGDSVVIDVGNADAFLTAVEGKRTKSRKVKGRRSRAEATVETPRVGRRPPLRLVLAGGLVLALVVAGVMAPTLVGSVFLFVGLILAVVAAVAVVEPKIAVRIPVGLEAMHIMVAGVSALVVGVALTFLA